MLQRVSRLAAAALAQAVRIGPPPRGSRLLSRLPSSPSPPLSSCKQPLRFLHGGINGPSANPVAIQMINYALSHARSQKSDESYAQGMLVLEQCLSNQSSDDRLAHDSKGMVLLAMSDLSYERGNLAAAIEHLQQIQNLPQSSLDVRVAAAEANVGLQTELGQDDASSEIADKCLEMLENDGSKSESVDLLIVRAKALKGLVELLRGNTESAELCFRGVEDHEGCTGNVALSYGEFLHATGNFSSAKAMYQKAIEGAKSSNESRDITSLGSCNMNLEEVLLGATFGLGQLESHMGNFADAEEVLTRALTKAEEYLGNHHPKLGVVLTGIALMFRNKAKHEGSSSFLIQEGLYRRALEFLKAPTTKSKEMNIERTDALALARGGYADLLCVQDNRKAEGEKLKTWAETAWRNWRFSLAKALDVSVPSDEVPVLDARTCRVM